MPNLLKLRQLGNPILRTKARQLSIDEIRSDETQQLIRDIRLTNETKKYGVGLAAPQVGVGVALSIIGIKPTPTRPDVSTFSTVIINPTYKGIGRRTGMWEGCQSIGSGRSILYGKVPRFKTIDATWRDEHGALQEERLQGFTAHVFQHETDHLNGTLFIDLVRDSTTFMMADEFRKRVVKQ